MNKGMVLRRKAKVSETIAGYLFIAPSFFGFIFFSLFPLILTIILSFSDWNLVSGLKGIELIGLGNYQEIVRDPTFYESLKNNILFALCSLPTLLILGFFGAIIINDFVFSKQVMKVVYFLPYISSGVAIATVWKVIFQPTYGPVNKLLFSIGVQSPPKWLADPQWALFTITLMFIWQNIGYYILIYVTGLQSLPKELYEAADIDGASRWIKIRNITIPLVAPTTFFLLITGIITSFKVFDAVQILTQGGPGSSSSVLVYYLYKVSFEFYKIGYGSTIAIMLFVVVLIITALQWRGQKRWVNYM